MTSRAPPNAATTFPLGLSALLALAALAALAGGCVGFPGLRADAEPPAFGAAPLLAPGESAPRGYLAGPAAGLKGLAPYLALPASESYAPATLTGAQERIVSGGRSLVGKRPIVVNGRSYPDDCTGVARAAYAFAGVDLAAAFNRYGGNGVRRIYLTVKDAGLLYATRYPAPGDLVFWDNTYDMNGNGKADDEFTHVGVVLSVSPDGGVEYLHHHYRLGPVIERMNLARPDDQGAHPDGGRVNAFMRMRGSPAGPGETSAELLRALARGWLLAAE